MRVRMACAEVPVARDDMVKGNGSESFNSIVDKAFGSHGQIGNIGLRKVMTILQRPYCLNKDIWRYFYLIQANGMVYLRLELLHFVDVVALSPAAIPDATEFNAGCIQLTNVENVILTRGKTNFRIPSGISRMTERGKILESVDVIRSMHNGFGGLDDSVPQATGNGGLQPFPKKPFNSIHDSQAAGGYFASQSGCEDIGFKRKVQAQGLLRSMRVGGSALSLCPRWWSRQGSAL